MSKLVKVLCCGDRNWLNKISILKVMRKRMPKLVIEGGAPGADTLAGQCADELGIAHCTFHANWGYYHKAAGPIRNQWMLNFITPDEVWAFHSDLERSKGTADMVARAKKANIPVRIFKD